MVLSVPLRLCGELSVYQFHVVRFRLTPAKIFTKPHEKITQKRFVAV